MQKLYFRFVSLLCLLLAFSGVSNAQAITATLGTGTLSSSTVGPVYVSSGTSTFRYSQHIAIYSAAEIAAAGGVPGDITKLRWFKNDNFGYTLNNATFRIYLKNVSFTTHVFTPINWFVELTGATSVYNSTTQNLNLSSGWQEFTLTTPFYWDGTSNVEVFVDWIRPGNATGAVGWRYTTVTNASSIIGSSTPPSSLNRSSTRPNLQMDIVPRRIINLGVTSVTAPNSLLCSADSTEDVIVRVKNYNIDTLFFATDPTTVRVDVSGPIPQTLTRVLNTGFIPPLAEQVYTVSNACNLSALGRYNFTAFTRLARDTVFRDDTSYSVTNNYLLPSNPIARADSGCGAGSRKLYASRTTGDLILWTRGMSIDTSTIVGDTLDLGVISSNQTRFVRAATGSSSRVGATEPSIGVGANSTTTGDGMFFTVSAPCLINTVTVYPNAPGVVVVNVLDSIGVTTIRSFSYNVGVPGPIDVPVNFFLSPGKYRMNMVGTTTGGLYRNSAGAVYPYTIPDVLSITGPISTTLPTYYYYFYNWRVTSLYCTSNPFAVTAAVNPFPSVNLGADTALCDAFPLVLNASSPSASSYVWSSGDTGATFNPLSTGTYSVIASNIFGCTDADTVNVTFYNTPDADLGNDTSVCTSTVLDAFNPGNSYLWTGGLTTQRITVNSSGNYFVQISNSNGCVDRDTVFILVNTPTVIDLGSDITQCGGAVTLDAGVSGVSYLWNDGSIGRTLTTSASGRITLVITDRNSCISGDTVDVEINPIPAPNLGPDKDLCGSRTLVLDAGNTGSGDIYNWSTGSTSQFIYPSSTGLYGVRVTTPAGCSGSDSVQITISTDVPNAAFLGDQQQCGGSVILDAGINPGCRFLWSTGATTQLLGVSTSGTYWVQVSNACGTDVSSSRVEITPNPVASFTVSGTNPYTFNNTSVGGLDYLWRFGDGALQSSTDITENPTHRYEYGGNFTVWLIVSGPCGSDSISSNVSVSGFGLGINSSVLENVEVYPNPFTDYIKVNSDIKDEMKFVITDMSGRAILNTDAVSGDAEISTTELASGVYFLRGISGDKQLFSAKLIKY